MLAAVLKDFDRLVLEDVPTPEPGMQEVVVRVKACGFCATDYKAIKGIRRNVTFPFIAGHEPAGIVAKVGVGVSNVKEGDDVVILGVGGIGLLCLMVAKAAGAGHLVAVDPSAYAREHALRRGATAALDPGDGRVRERIYGIMPQGPDLVVEAAGPIEAVRLMADLRRRGTRWNVFGITTHETFELDGGLTHFLEARMDASFGTTPLAMQKAIRLMERGLVDPEAIITHRFPLADIHQAVAVMGRPDRNKVIVHP